MAVEDDSSFSSILSNDQAALCSQRGPACRLETGKLANFKARSRSEVIDCSNLFYIESDIEVGHPRKFWPWKRYRMPGKGNAIFVSRVYQAKHL